MSTTLNFYLNYTSANAYLALAPTYQLAQSLGVEVSVQVLVLARNTPPVSKATAPIDAGETKGERHARVRAAYYWMDQCRYARLQGIELKKPAVNSTMECAAMGHLWVLKNTPERERAYHEGVFAAYWCSGLDIGQFSVVHQALADASCPTDGFDNFVQHEGPGQLAQLQQQLEQAGVFGAPSYLVAGEYFVGRQHLPSVADLLRGGVAP